MEKKLDEFIKNICINECENLFVSSQIYCIQKIKESLPKDIFSKKTFDIELQLEITDIASPIIKRNNKINKNRFWNIYYLLSEKLIHLKCTTNKYSYADKMMCIEYILDKALKQLKKFDINHTSPIFDKVESNFMQINNLYKTESTLRLNIDLKDITYLTGATGNYTKKILDRYSKDIINIETVDILIENTLLNLQQLLPKKSFNIKKTSIEDELLIRCNNNKIEVQNILYPLLLELLYEEKFFNYINNHFIKTKYIDFTDIVSRKYESLTNMGESLKKKAKEYSNELEIEELILSEILEKYLDIIPLEVQVLLKLKIGEKLDNSNFIKLAYLLDYREINIFKNFEDTEVLEIKFYARNNIALSKNIKRKISKVREKLENDSYTDIEESISKTTLLKLIFHEEMSAKEIGLLLDYTENKIYKKIENIKNKIKYKKESLCKEI